MKAFLDIDGVLNQYVSAACKLHDKPNPYETEPDNWLGRWDFFAAWGGMPAWKFYHPQNLAFWTNIPLADDAQQIVAEVEAKFGRDNVCLLTAPVLVDGCLEGKAAWVRSRFPQHSKRLLIGSCKEFCASPDACLIDDSDDNVNKFRAAGGNAILVPRPWNSLHGADTLTYLREALCEI